MNQKLVPDYARAGAKAYACLKDPDLKLLNQRLVDLAVEMGEDVELSLDTFLSTFRFPETIFLTLREFRETYDRLLREVLTREGMTPSCNKGCSTCCREFPSGVEPLEIMEIVHRVQSRPDFEEILSGSRRALRAFQQLHRNVSTEGNRGETDVEFQAKVLRNYVSLGIPCVFLNPTDGSCGIYDIRPLICRAVFSLADPALCHPDHPQYDTPARKVEIIEPVDEVNYALLHINATISQALGFRFPDTLQGGVPLWAEWLLRHGKGSSPSSGS